MSKIPEGATHTAPDGTYRMARDGLWYGCADGDWVYIEGAAPNCYTKIQAEPEWSGEGLPPVGIVCERSFNCSTWKITTICGHSTDGAYASFYDGDGFMGWSDDCKFRPIQTNEQIEAEARKEFLSRAHKIYMEGAADHRGGIMALYDAGLRFVEVTE